MGIRAWIGFTLVIAICLMLVLLSTTVYRPRRQVLADVTSELALSDTEQAFVAGNAERLERILDFLPQKPEEENAGEQLFLSRISAKLQSLGVTLTSMEPHKVQQDGSFTRRSFRLELEGGYRQLAIFMRYLELLPEVVIIDSFDIRSKELRQAGDHTATMTVTVIGY